MTDADVIVVGAGVVGCAAARTLSTDYDVMVIDADGVAAGATGRSAGLVAPTLFYGDRPEVARLSNRFFREFDGTGSFAFAERPRLDFVAFEDEVKSRRRADDLAGRGFPVEFLDAESVEERFPVSAAGFAGAVLYGDTGWVDPYTYARTLLADAEDRGASVERTTVRGLLLEDDVVEGVETDAGRREASRVVVAAGWRTPSLLDGVVSLPVRPYRTQCVVLDPGEPLDEAFPMGRVRSEELYFRPEHNGDLLVGGGHSTPANPESASRRCDEAFRRHVATTVPRLLPGLGDAGFVDGWAGLDAATPDARPIVDSVGPDGLVVATGFNGLGVMASPVAAIKIRTLVTDESPPVPLSWLGLDRLASSPGTFDLQTTSEL